MWVRVHARECTLPFIGGGGGGPLPFMGGGGGGGPPGGQAMVLYEHMPELLEETRDLNFDFKKLIWNSSYLWLAVIGLVLFFHKRK